LNDFEIYTELKNEIEARLLVVRNIVALSRVDLGLVTLMQSFKRNNTVLKQGL
jgi:hypothetical protein